MNQYLMYHLGHLHPTAEAQISVLDLSGFLLIYTLGSVFMREIYMEFLTPSLAVAQPSPAVMGTGRINKHLGDPLLFCL